MNFKQAKLAPHKAIFVGEESNLYLILKNLVKSHDWVIEQFPCAPTKAVTLFHESNASGYIILDSPSIPAAESIKIIRQDARSIVAPTLVLLGESTNHAIDIYSRFFSVHIASKPITTNNFAPTFKKMLLFWNQPAVRALQQCVIKSTPQNREDTIAVLRKLLQVPETVSFALATLVLLYVDAGYFTEAETVLIDTLKKNTRNQAILAICGWFYMDCKMPTQALLFLQKLKQISVNSTILNLDIGAAHLASSNYDHALQEFLEWSTKNPGNDLMSNFIARLALANGRGSDLEGLNISSALMRKISDQWTLVANANAPADQLKTPATHPPKSSTYTSTTQRVVSGSNQKRNPLFPRKNAS
jgi:hypothetical protein